MGLRHPSRSARTRLLLVVLLTTAPVLAEAVVLQAVGFVAVLGWRRR